MYLYSAEDEAKQMGDEYVSVEHLFLCYDQVSKYSDEGVSSGSLELARDGFLQALSTVRGNQRVTSDNPEATYDTLNKYGYRSGGACKRAEAGSSHRT